MTIPEKEVKSTILLSAECWQGVMRACNFAGQFLSGPDTEMVIFQTYQAPRLGTSTLRNLDPLLKKIGNEELTFLKDKLIGDYGIPHERIHKKLLEGDLNSLISDVFQDYPNPALVVGSDMDKPFGSDSCGNILRKLLAANIRPVFLITNCITIIEADRIFVVCEKQDEDVNSFLEEIKSYTKGAIHIISTEKDEEIFLEDATKKFIRRNGSASEYSSDIVEKLFVKCFAGIT